MSYKFQNDRIIDFIFYHYIKDKNEEITKKLHHIKNDITAMDEVCLSKDISMLPLLITLDKFKSLNINYYSRRQSGITTNINKIKSYYNNIIFIDDYLTFNNVIASTLTPSCHTKNNINKLIKIYKNKNNIDKECYNSDAINIKCLSDISKLLDDCVNLTNVNINLNIEDISVINYLSNYIVVYNNDFKILNEEVGFKEENYYV